MSAITSKEREALRLIVNSEYQDGGDPVGNAVWLDYIFNSKSRGGVLTSLKSKGLVGFNLSPDRPSGTITESTVWITEEGMEAYSNE